MMFLRILFYQEAEEQGLRLNYKKLSDTLNPTGSGMDLRQ